MSTVAPFTGGLSSRLSRPKRAEGALLGASGVKRNCNSGVYLTSAGGLLLSLALVIGCGSDSRTESATTPNYEFGDGPDVQTDQEVTRLPVLAIADNAPLVTFLGDSICAGLFLDAKEAFPAILQRQLFESGQAFRLVNAGVSGDTSAGCLSRVDWLLNQAPDILVLETGFNDGMRGLPTAQLETNLKGIIEKAQAAEVPVLLLGVRIPPSFGESYAEDIASIYPRLAEAYQLPYVPFFMHDVGGIPELNMPDGMHPTAAGHEKLADNVAPELSALLERLQSGH